MQIDTFLDDRRALLTLFALADDSAAQIQKYYLMGEVLVARDRGEIVAHLQLVDTHESRTLEIKSLAVTEMRQRQGVGSLLIEAAVRRCERREARCLIVATATADTGNLRFYQRHGFRMYRLVPDAFTPSNGYAIDAAIDGIALRDQVFLRRDIP